MPIANFRFLINILFYTIKIKLRHKQQDGPFYISGKIKFFFKTKLRSVPAFKISLKVRLRVRIRVRFRFGVRVSFKVRSKV